jgi:hypothetical protein
MYKNIPVAYEKRQKKSPTGSAGTHGEKKHRAISMFFTEILLTLRP